MIFFSIFVMLLFLKILHKQHIVEPNYETKIYLLILKNIRQKSKDFKENKF